MTMDVRATGLKWFNSDGDDILGTGTTIDLQQSSNVSQVIAKSFYAKFYRLVIGW